VYAAVDALRCRAIRFSCSPAIGALCWLPDIQRWAEVVAALLKPGGRLFLREGHPMLWAIDEKHTDRLVVDYPYFETVEPIVSKISGHLRADRGQVPAHHTHSWNHGLGRSSRPCSNHGLTLTQLVEHDSVPWEAQPA